MNTNFKRFLSANNFSVDESMIPYYNRHTTNPYDLGLNFGVYARQMSTSSCGTILWKRYEFVRNRIKQGSYVVLGMIEKCDLTKGSTVAMGNFFITLPLLDKLTDIDMYGVGIIWENRLQGAPLKKKAAFQKETRANIWLHIWCKQFSCCMERQQRCHRCHQLFVAKSSFVNKALVEIWEKTYRRTNAKSFQGL